MQALHGTLVRPIASPLRTPWTMAPRDPQAQRPSAKLHLVPAEQLLTQHCDALAPQCTYIVSPAVAANMDFPAARFAAVHGLLAAQSYVVVSIEEKTVTAGERTEHVDAGRPRRRGGG